MSADARKAIEASFWKLLEERPLDQITVRDIVEDCRLNRNTFYYHFDSIPALLNEIARRNADEIVQKHAASDSPEGCLDTALLFTLEHRRAILHIFQSANRAVYERNLMRLCGHAVEAYARAVFAPLSREDADILLRFYQCELFGQIIHWIDQNMEYDLRAQYHRLCQLHRGIPMSRWFGEAGAST